MTSYPVYIRQFGHGQTILTFVKPEEYPVKQGTIFFKGDGARPPAETRLTLWTGSGTVMLTVYEALDLAVNNLRGLSWEPEGSPNV